MPSATGHVNTTYVTLLDSFGHRLAAARRRKGLEQGQLAEMIGVHPKTISRWERDKQPAELENVEQLAKVLDVRMEWLRSGSGEPQASVVSEERVFYQTARPTSPLDRLPSRAASVVRRYMEMMSVAGATNEQLDTAMRLMVDAAFNKINTRDVRSRSEEELVTDIDAAWDWIRTILRREGKRL